MTVENSAPGARPVKQAEGRFTTFARGTRSFMLAGFESVAHHRTILSRTTIAEVRNIYAGSLLGSLWLVFGQIIMLGIYALTYVIIFQIRPADMTVYEYILYVFCGLTSFLAISGGLTAGTMSLASNRAVLLNTVFPAELIPLRSVLVASAGMPIGAIILLFTDITIGEVTWTNALIPLVMILQVMFVTGVSWILSLFALVFRDIQYLVYYGIMMLMFITPIAYTPQMMPEGLTFLIKVNPAAYYVMSFQYLIMLDQLPPYDMMLWMIGISLGTFMLGFYVCRRVKGTFYDYA